MRKIQDSPLLDFDLRWELKGSLIYESRIFHMLNPSSIAALIEHLQSQIAIPREPILVEGSIGKSMFFISRGKCTIYKDIESPDGVNSDSEGRNVIGELGGGDAFGEIAMLNDQPRTCNVEAVMFVELEQLDKEFVIGLCDQHEDLRGILEALAQERVHDGETATRASEAKRAEWQGPPEALFFRQTRASEAKRAVWQGRPEAQFFRPTRVTKRAVWQGRPEA